MENLLLVTLRTFFFDLGSFLKVIFLLCYQSKNVPKAEIEILSYVKAEKRYFDEKSQKRTEFLVFTIFFTF